MSVILTQKDWLLISAYLDGRLTDAELTAFKSRLASDTDLKISFQEISYTRSLLKALPQKRAPRNFTLSAEYSKKSALKWGLNRLFGFASAASAVALAVIFAWTNLFTFAAKTAAPAPMMAAVPEMAMDNAASAEDAAVSTPMIIFWGRPGIGGGGGGDTSSMATGMGGYGGGPAEIVEHPVSLPAATQIPEASAKVAATQDPSTLILGLPSADTEVETLQYDSSEVNSFSSRIQPSTLWMVGLGAVTLLFAILAIFLRKR